MEVGGILAPSAINKIGQNQWLPGERLQVEVVRKTGDKEGTIRVKGQDIFAILETSTELGDKFWVKVGDIKEGNLLLIREPLLAKQGDSLVQQPIKQMVERGLPDKLDITTFLKTFLTGDADLLGSVMGNLQRTFSEKFMLNFKKSIPKWEELSEENGAEEIVECLRKLGLNYEQRLQMMLKLDSQAKETEMNSLRETFKYALLQELQRQEEQSPNLDGTKGDIEHLLQKITGQQLWLKTGAMENAYLLLHLPLFNKEHILPIQIAIESARKGPKMDERHCRVAVQLETQLLGEIGIDAFFNQDTLSFRVLTHDLELLPRLLEEIMPETRVQFAKLGFNIEKVETGDLDYNLEFQNFLRGSRRSGVDIQR